MWMWLLFCFCQFSFHTHLIWILSVSLFNQIILFNPSLWRVWPSGRIRTSSSSYKTCSSAVESFCLFVVCSDCRVVCCSEAWWWRVWRRWRFTTKMKFIRSWREDRPRGGRRPRSWTPTPGKLSSAERSHLWMISVTFTSFYVRLAFGLFTIFPSCVPVKSLPLCVLGHHPHEGDHSGWRGAGEDRQTQSGN